MLPYPLKSHLIFNYKNIFLVYINKRGGAGSGGPHRILSLWAYELKIRPCGRVMCMQSLLAMPRLATFLEHRCNPHPCGTHTHTREQVWSEERRTKPSHHFCCRRHFGRGIPRRSTHTCWEITRGRTTHGAIFRDRGIFFLGHSVVEYSFLSTNRRTRVLRLSLPPHDPPLKAIFRNENCFSFEHIGDQSSVYRRPLTLLRRVADTEFRRVKGNSHDVSVSPE